MAKVATLDIVKHDGEVYVKEARKAEVGEKILVINAEATAGRYDNGDILTVDEIGGIGLPIANDESLFHREYNVLVPLKPGAKVTVDGVEYEVSDRKARDGDYVVIHDRDNEDEPYNNGDVLQVFRRGSLYGLYVMLDGEEVYVLNEECLTLIPVAKSNESNPKEGDEMASIDERIAELERQLAELKAEKEQETETQRLKVGEYAVITNSRYATLSGFSDGDVVIVKKSSHGEDDCDYYVMNLKNEVYGYAHKERCVRRATPEEVAEAKRKLAEQQAKQVEEAKWAKIGRKVGEFKAGDVVRFKEDTGVSKYPEGSLAILDRVYGDYADFDRFGALLYWLELVVPVEQRFDRQINEM